MGDDDDDALLQQALLLSLATGAGPPERRDRGSRPPEHPDRGAGPHERPDRGARPAEPLADRGARPSERPADQGARLSELPEDWGAGPLERLGQAPPEVRKLLSTVATNLRRAAAPGCNPEARAKFRQLNDGAVRRRLQGAGGAATYEAAAACLRALGFELSAASAAQERHWALPPGFMPPPPLLAEVRRVLATGAAEAAPPPQGGGGGAGARGADARGYPGGGGCGGGGQPSRPHSVAHGNGGASGRQPPPRPHSEAPGGGGQGSTALPRPHSEGDFDVLELGPLADLPALRLLVYPCGFSQLVAPRDCLAWARQVGSQRSLWGGYGRGGEDDRVVLSLYCGLPRGRRAGCAAHWYDHRGDEQSMPHITCRAGDCEDRSTYMNQTYLLRLLPQQDVAVCGLKITGRPYVTEGHLLALLLPSGISAAELLQICDRILASVPEDGREARQQTHARPRKPPSDRTRRGPWG